MTHKSVSEFRRIVFFDVVPIKYGQQTGPQSYRVYDQFVFRIQDSEVSLDRVSDRVRYRVSWRKP